MRRAGTRARGPARRLAAPGSRLARAAVLLLLAGGFVVAAAAATADLPVPFLSGRVVDEAGLLPPQSEAAVSAKLEAYERETGSQIAVLTIPSLEGEPLEDYSIRVAEAWQLGRGEVDDGVLFLVARDDRQMRLEVGYGLEPQLTDLASRRILDEVVRPRFRDGDFAGGIDAGTDAVITVLRGGEDALPEPVATRPDGVTWTFGLMAVVFSLFLVLSFGSAAVSQEGCGGWFLAFFLTPFFFAFPSAMVHPALGVGLAALWLVFFVSTRLYYRNRPKPRWMRSTGRSGGGFFAGGGRGGGGFSGGGFSGGGGGFGGGGASSSW